MASVGPVFNPLVSSSLPATVVGVDVEGLLDPDVKSRIETAVVGPGVVSVCGPPSMVDVAFGWVSERVRSGEVLVAEPGVKGWNVAEFQVAIAPVVSARPTGGRWVMMLSQVDTMARGIHDRLLKLLEEPRSPTTFLLGVADPEQLPAALRSRVSTSLRVERPDANLVVPSLVAAGVERQVAVRLADVDVSLLTRVIGDPSAARLLAEILDCELWPVRAAAAVDGLLDRVRQLVTQVVKDGESSRKMVEGLVFEALLARWERAVAADCVSLPAVELLGAVDRCREGFRRHRPPRSVLMLAVMTASVVVGVAA